ncbi:hypothetical protein CRN61_25220 [Vibrio vulnificus]|nr:hypothetical protein CRN61_25220 [Vibrio vulnificus]
MFKAETSITTLLGVGTGICGAAAIAAIAPVIKSKDKDIANESATKVDLSTKVGETIAKKASDKGIKEIVFDRGGYLYHGRVKALAEAARENGLEF